MRRRLRCPNCNMASNWDIKLASNWYIRCYKCKKEYDLEREKRPKQKKKKKLAKRLRWIGK